MISHKQPYKFQDKITVDFLLGSYTNHQQNAEELALSEVSSIELAMPRFNTAASLNKFDFNKLMSNIKRKSRDTQVFTVMVAAICDTFTCMIQSSRFYDNYNDDNKHGLNVLMDLLHTIQLMLVTYKRGSDIRHYETLISILERSASRIQNEKAHYDIMQQIISSLKKHKQHLSEKENTIQAEAVSHKTDNIDPKIVQGNILKYLLPTTDKCENISTNAKDLNSPVKLQQLPIGSTKLQTNNNKPNAFELMMMSSKKLGAKKKRIM